jgi:ribose-phosphate pyrophosphokinase
VELATMAVFSGNAHPQLAQDIARYLCIPLARAHVGRFSDGEINVEILENIRGRETFIVQPTCPPTAENLMELLVMVDAARRASASRITAVIPYFGFARQDRRPRASRVPITAKLVAKLIGTSGVDRVLTVDLLADVWKQKYKEMVVVSPDVGGVVRARALAKRLGDADLAIIDKRRARANQSEVMNIIGEVEGKNCVMIDDMVDTAGTLCHAAMALKDHGAESVTAYITHPVLSGPAVSRITESELDEMVVTDTIPLNEEARACEKIRQLSVAEMLAETMRRIAEEESVSSLYVD